MVTNMKESLTDDGANIINESLQNLNDLTAAILQPIIGITREKMLLSYCLHMFLF